MLRCLRYLTLMLALGCASAVAQAADQTYRHELLRIPTDTAGSEGLEAVLVRPAADGRYPLALINHGSPRNPADRAEMTVYGYWPQIMEFARRGWAVAAVMRRGFGMSGGGFAENAGTCNNPDYVRAGRAAAQDLRATIAYLTRRPDIDASRVLSVGQSAGGFATVALSADPPTGLVAAINFAGGRGSPKDGEVCSAGRLEAAFATFGKASRLPMLWVYADNDLFFSPQVVERLHQAFTAGGGDAQYIKHPPFGRDGHALFSTGTQLWLPYVDAYLQSRGLVLRDNLLPLPLPDIAPPAALGENGRRAFRDYLLSGPHKAFAMSPKGTFGWRAARRAPEAAQGSSAMENCRRNDADCRIVFVDETPVGP